ncbi:MAG TPA: chemotaxis protein CheW [Cyanobacteria bacterium UBA12227]|nr:chemotaxis protein CheW [Cyanobacteria bacterium UBA12227]HAX90335.1 chemotaxis protein CheW [Cyanobacteria bacterium UBA11370]HBY78662.1 chemotaxis protein CheW [Cyanobacteria bacterium UBA11148]
MAIFSPISSRRYANRKAQATQQLIVFSLYSEGFALPIRSVQKVIPMGKIYGAPEGGAAGLILYQEQELLVLDVEHRIFKGTPRQKLSLSSSSQDAIAPVFTVPEEQEDQSLQRYLLIVQNRAGKIVGLPIDSAPSLQRIPESAFTPLTPDYMAEGNIRCVSALIIQNKDKPPLFLLNPEQLVQSQQSLSPGGG